MSTTTNNVWLWSKTAGSNASVDAGINWAEGQQPPSINDSARGMMAAFANYRDDHGAITTTGGTTSYSLTTNSGFAALATGLTVIAKMNATNTGATTLNVDGLGAKAVKSYSQSGGEIALSGGELQATARYIFVYDTALAGGAGAWVVLNPTPAVSATGNYVPTGAIMPFAMSSPPTGWLECNGAAVSRSTYAALFTAISTTYGAGDGSSTFNLPDMRGYFPRGWDNSRGVDTGRVFGSTQADALTSHTHTFSASVSGTTGSNGDHSHNLPSTGASGGIGAGSQKIVYGAGTYNGVVSDTTGAHTHTFSGTASGTTDANGSAASEVRVKNIALLFCIRT